MKKILWVMTLAVVFAACDNAETDQRISELEAENAKLEQIAAEKDSVLRAFDETFTMISRNLSMIREGEETIRIESRNVELSGDQRQAIEAEIQDINALLQANKEQIKDLNTIISRYKGDVGRYKNLVASLEEQIANKDREIEDLKKNLVAANFTIEILNKMNEELAEEIRKTQTTLERVKDDAHTVYYVIGTFKELKEKGIAERAGLMAGKKMQQDFNKDDFIAIDRREVKEIQLTSDKAEVISTHPSGSYEMHGAEEENHRLVIVDENKFWSVNNFLVVQIK